MDSLCRHRLPRVTKTSIPDSEMLLAGLEQSDSEVEAERELQQQEDATAAGAGM